MGKQFILNPETNRYIVVGKDKYNKLLKEGKISAFIHDNPEPNGTPLDGESSDDEPEQLPKPELTREKSHHPQLKKKMMETVIPEMLPDARKIDPDLTDKEVDKLLKKMLYAKLVGDDSPKKKRKKRKKKKRVYYSSSSESSDSE